MDRKTYCIKRRYGHDDYEVVTDLKTFSHAEKELNAWGKLNPSASYYISQERR